MTFEILDALDGQRVLIMIDGDIISCVGIGLDNRHYKMFLEWNAQQAEPLTIPESWPQE